MDEMVRTICESSRVRSMRSNSAAALTLLSFMIVNRASREVDAVGIQTGGRSAKARCDLAILKVEESGQRA